MSKKIATELIEESVATGESIIVDKDEGKSLYKVFSNLCENYVNCVELLEGCIYTDFWGTNEDGEQWRVYIIDEEETDKTHSLRYNQEVLD